MPPSVQRWRCGAICHDCVTQNVFEAWSYRILVNARKAEGRRSKRWLPALSPAPDVDPVAEQAFSSVVHRDQLERGFRRLPPDQREVVVLHHYLRLPLREVAGILDIKEGTAHSRLHRAMSTLRAALEADERLPARDPNSQKGVA